MRCEQQIYIKYRNNVYKNEKKNNQEKVRNK